MNENNSMVSDAVNPNVVTFGIPRGEVKGAYFDLILKQLYNLGIQLSQPTPLSGSSVPLMVNFVISHVPHEQHRLDIRNEIKKELLTRLEGVDDDEDKTKIKLDVYVESIGNIADYLERFMGIETENRLGFIGSPETKDE